MSEFYTHRPYLENELAKLSTNATIVELGVGDGSSQLMSDFANKNSNARVYAFESDNEWVNKMSRKFASPLNYIFSHVSDWNSIRDIITCDVIDLLFVDQSPWEARIQSIDLLSHIARVIILHDYDYFNKIDSGWAVSECTDIYVNDKTSWLHQTYSPKFILESKYSVLPPTLIMRNREKL